MPVEIVFVSSDASAEAMSEYMREMHGDWLAVPWDGGLREGLKQQYGSFAGKEQQGFPHVERRNGIPNVVVVGPDGEELFCEPGEGSLSIETEGRKALSAWAGKWPWPNLSV